jgi:hypothetical protein
MRVDIIIYMAFFCRLTGFELLFFQQRGLNCCVPVILFFVDLFTPFGVGSLHLGGGSACSALCTRHHNSLYSRLQCQPICEGETVSVKVTETHMCFSVCYTLWVFAPMQGCRGNHSLVGEEAMALQLRESR